MVIKQKYKWLIDITDFDNYQYLIRLLLQAEDKWSL